MKFKILLVLHLVAVHSSIAAMEAVSWLIFFLAVCSMIWEGKKPLRFGCDFWLLGFFVTAVVGFALSGMSSKEFLFELGTLRWIFLLYSFAYAWNESDFWMDPERIIWIWAGLAALVGVYSFWQYFSGIDLARPHKLLSQTSSGNFRATGFFSLALTLAYVLGISISFLIPCVALVKSKKIYWGLLGLASMGIFASLSRGAWIALLVVVFIYGFMRVGWKVFWGLLPLGFASVLMFFTVNEFRYRILNIFEYSSGSSSGERLDIWRGYWRIFLDHPFFGAGLFYGDEQLPEVYQRLGIIQDFVSHAHNNFLQILAGTGIFGLSCFLVISFYFLKVSYQAMKYSASPEIARLAEGIFLAQIFWQLGGLTECNFFDGEVNHTAILLWGMSQSLFLNSRRQRLVKTDFDALSLKKGSETFSSPRS